MILPQVHLRKPCYDFYLPLNDQFESASQATMQPWSRQAAQSLNLHRIIQSVVATGGVYKGQGRNQREMMTRTY